MSAGVKKYVINSLNNTNKPPLLTGRSKSTTNGVFEYNGSPLILEFKVTTVRSTLCKGVRKSHITEFVQLKWESLY